MTTGHHAVATLPLAASTSRKVIEGGGTGGGVGHDAEGDAHEVGPDRQRGLRAREAQHVPLSNPTQTRATSRGV